MADIELVIKIDESKLWSLKNEPIKENFNIYELASYIDKGVPLQKGHGKLIDADESLKAMNTWDKFGFDHTGCFVRDPKDDFIDYVHYEDMVKAIRGTQTIIEADNVENEGQDTEEINFIQPKKTIGKLISIDVLDKIKTEIEQTASRYTISRERGAMGQVEWSDRLIKESEVLEVLDKYKAKSEE